MNKKYLAVLGVMILPFLPLPVFANGNGEIQELMYTPSEPVVFDDVSVTIGINNPDGNPHNYLLEVELVKDGKITDSQEFIFSLEKGKKITFTPGFVLQDIGRHEVIVNLYDRFKFDIYDTKVIEFDSVSNIGPFDIIVEPLTSRVRPGFLLPAIITLQNMGTRSTDIEVRVSISCPNGNVLAQSATVFVPSRNQTELLMSMRVCDQEGSYDVIGSVILFNKTWITSSNQFFINSSYIQLDFNVPENITLTAGDTLVLPIKVRNTGNEIVNDLKLVVQRFPIEWQTVSPSSVPETSPNETVIFLVSITVPKDAESKLYEARMTAVSKETLERKTMMMQVAPLITSVATPGYITYWWIPSLLVAAAIGSAIYKITRLKKYNAPYAEQRSDILKKIKEKIRGK